MGVTSLTDFFNINGQVPYWIYVLENSIKIWKFDLSEKFDSNGIRTHVFQTDGSIGFPGQWR